MFGLSVITFKINSNYYRSPLGSPEHAAAFHCKNILRNISLRSIVIMKKIQVFIRQKLKLRSVLSVSETFLILCTSHFS